MSSAQEILMMSEWDHITKRVLNGLKRIGRDIPITGYSSEDNMSLGKRKPDNQEK